MYRSSSRRIVSGEPVAIAAVWGDERGAGPDGEEEPDTLWRLVAGPLSSTALRLRGIRSRYAGDARLVADLDALIEEVDQAFTEVMRSPSSRIGHVVADGEPTRTAREPADGSAEAMFCAWIRRRCPERLPAAADEPVCHPDELLRLLATAGAPPPADVVATMGLRGTASYADTAWLLTWARHAANGPRCRSYRSALYFLTSADLGDLSGRGEAVEAR